MTYDGLLLAAVVAELNRRIVGGRIQSVRQHNDTDLTLEVRAPGHTYRLFLSVHAQYPRAYLTASSIPVPRQPPQFALVLRKHLGGAFVTRVEQVGFDRIIRLHLRRPDSTVLYLIHEIMGKHSNLILTTDGGRILDAVKHVGRSISRYRQVLPGRNYGPPPGAGKADLRNIDETDFERLWESSLPDQAEDAGVRKWLMETFSGFGPFLAEEVAARASEAGVVRCERVRDELLRIRETVEGECFEPVLMTSEDGRTTMVYPVPSVQLPPSLQHPRTSINEALDALFRSLIFRSKLEDERSRLLSEIRRAAAARRQTLKSIQRTIAESEKAERYRQIGDLLMGSLQSIGKGAKCARLTDFFDPDMPEVEVELDERLSPRENAELYFRRFRKAREAASSAVERERLASRDLSVLDSASREAESAQTPGSLAALRKMLVDQNILRREAARERPSEDFGGERIRSLITPDGWQILYGENSQANDRLTQRVARPEDVWLHARSVTGAHVVIRTAGHSGGVPAEVLRQAALIAAANSEAKHSSLVPVDYTLRKYVRKPRGAAPGYVVYRNEKTVDVRPSR